MGWWTAPGQPEIAVGDAPLDAVRHFLVEFSREYMEDFSRKPTLKELEYTLSLAFKVNADDDVLAGVEELEVKQVVLKTAKKPKRQKVAIGDIFAFRFDEQRFGFGRIVSNLTSGTVVEMFDYFSEIPVFNPNYSDTWLLPPFTINAYLLLETRRDGDWRIIGHTPDFQPGEKFAELRFVYGGMPHMLTAVDIHNNSEPISAEAAEGKSDYVIRGDANVKRLIQLHLHPTGERE